MNMIVQTKIGGTVVDPLAAADTAVPEPAPEALPEPELPEPAPPAPEPAPPAPSHDEGNPFAAYKD